ncbi:MAG TPA: di-heme oxidoredictase family protein [Polyangiaceae bacterium]|nr:di-heme oxidoredictase family protein [Polyangiaceae bacterium]
MSLKRSGIVAVAALVAVAASMAAACGTEQGLRPVGTEEDGSSARPLGIFSKELSEDVREQTLEALERDARRRESRFLDAADPGYLLRSTRASQGDIEADRWTPAELFEIGAQLFDVTFTKAAGFGAKDLPPLGRFHTGRRGGPDATRCSACHWRGGPAGAGDGADNAYLDGDGDSQQSTLARNPISLAGAGLVEILASEMTRDLRAAKEALIAAATSSETPKRGELIAKGVSFGFLTVRADGSLDTSEVAGVDPDLTVRPFGWKGNIGTIRDAVEDELLTHHGMQSDHIAASAPPERAGPFARPDPDGDGVTREIEEGQVTALTLFIAMQEVPQIMPPNDSELVLAWSQGRARFESIGCARCHVSSLTIDSPVFVLPSRSGGSAVTVDLTKDGASPRLGKPAEGGPLRVHLFSDLKRHDVGPQLKETRADRGVAREQFLTRPLWGLARSRPYMHDGRAPTIEDAIRFHAGEAQAEREAYDALTEAERAGIRIYLTALTRARRMISP